MTITRPRYRNVDTLEAINRYLDESIDPYRIVSTDDGGCRVTNIVPAYSEDLARDLTDAGITISSTYYRNRENLSASDRADLVEETMKDLGYVVVVERRVTSDDDADEGR